MQLDATLLRRLFRAPGNDFCSQTMLQGRKNKSRLNGLHEAKMAR
jgi:hypothetical protein